MKNLFNGAKVSYQYYHFLIVNIKINFTFTCICLQELWMFITDVYLMKLLTENVMKKFLCLEKLGFWGKYTLSLMKPCFFVWLEKRLFWMTAKFSFCWDSLLSLIKNGIGFYLLTTSISFRNFISTLVFFEMLQATKFWFTDLLQCFLSK